MTEGAVLPGAPPRGRRGGARRVPALLLAPALLWIGFFFLVPLILMCWRSLASEHFSPAAYATLFTAPLYVKVMVTTFKIALLTMVVSILLGYPLAYVLTMCGSKLRAFLLICILTPYWVDVIVRSFSWLIMLGDHGLINKALIGAGLIAQPVQLLYTLFSVLVGMIQILLPLTIVTLFGAMLRIDRRLLIAAKIHGASEWQAFRTVFLPLSLPGVYGAALLVFVLAMGFYVTPALLGSPKETMIAQTIMIEATETLDWGQASAAGMALLIITIVITAVYNRYFSLDRLWGGHD